MSGICQQAFKRKVNSTWLLILITVLPELFEKFLQARELCGRQMLGLHQAHYETLRRTAKQPINYVCNLFTDNLLTTNGWLIKIGAVLEVTFDLALLVQDIEHGLHGRVRQFAIQLLLYGLDIGRSGFPQNMHNLQFEWC